MEIEAYKYILVLKIQHLIWIKNYAWKQQLYSKKNAAASLGVGEHCNLFNICKQREHCLMH